MDIQLRFDEEEWAPKPPVASPQVSPKPNAPAQSMLMRQSALFPFRSSNNLSV